MRAAAAKLKDYSKAAFASNICENCGGPHGRHKCKMTAVMRKWFGTDQEFGALMKHWDSNVQSLNATVSEKRVRVEHFQ